MSARQENSVLFALNDLRQIETERVAEEAEREAERVRRQEAERARVRAAEVEALRQAEERERLASALTEAEIRNRALSAELSTMGAAIERLSRAPEALPTAPAPPGRLGWPIAFACAGILATALAVLLVTRAPEIRERVVIQPAPVTAPGVPPPPAPAVVAAPVVTAPPAEPSRRRPARRTAPAPTRPVLPDLDKCGGDPLCGVELAR